MAVGPKFFHSQGMDREPLARLPHPPGGITRVSAHPLSRARRAQRALVAQGQALSASLIAWYTGRTCAAFAGVTPPSDPADFLIAFASSRFTSSALAVCCHRNPLSPR